MSSEPCVPTPPLPSLVRDYLLNCRELTRFCSQNGWIDNDTLRFHIERVTGGDALVSVRFTEVIMEGSGCVADRKACYGQLWLEIGADGRIATSREA